jgi:hypothetical protein
MAYIPRKQGLSPALLSKSSSQLSFAGFLRHIFTGQINAGLAFVLMIALSAAVGAVAQLAGAEILAAHDPAPLRHHILFAKNNTEILGAYIQVNVSASMPSYSTAQAAYYLSADSFSGNQQKDACKLPDARQALAIAGFTTGPPARNNFTNVRIKTKSAVQNRPFRLRSGRFCCE